MTKAFLFLAAAGHLVTWVSLANRIHALAIPRWAISILTSCCWLCLLTAPLVIVAFPREGPQTFRSGMGLPRYAMIYLVPCSLVAPLALASRIADRRRQRRCGALISNHTTTMNLAEKLGSQAVGSKATAILTRLPGNEILKLAIQHKTLRIARLDPVLDGLSIVHLSDLHMSGRIGKRYFAQVVELANELEPDLVAITGDLFDAAVCLDWVEGTLGALRARYGCYYVRGNHDLRVDWRRAKERLDAAGLVGLGGCWREATIRGTPVILAGNELPWFVPAADIERCPPSSGGWSPLRILLSHAPDQIDWARRFDFDLMLAGHTHGGQICLPLVGSIVSPSRWGTRYAAGVYELAPTVLHVSRGVSSLTPLRWNCPPELSLLELRNSAFGNPANSSLSQVLSPPLRGRGQGEGSSDLVIDS